MQCTAMKADGKVHSNVLQWTRKCPLGPAHYNSFFWKLSNFSASVVIFSGFSNLARRPEVFYTPTCYSALQISKPHTFVHHSQQPYMVVSCCLRSLRLRRRHHKFISSYANISQLCLQAAEAETVLTIWSGIEVWTLANESRCSQVCGLTCQLLEVLLLS